eukprot:scpid77635/ scgid12757/ 3-hydroxyacyl-CoA dehydratase 2; Protein-tyrosine phosphatase-like member B
MKSVTLAYLIAYNLVQWLGWLSIGVMMAVHLVQNDGNHRELFNAVELPLVLLQASGILETIHSILGISKSSPAAAFMQYLGRGFALFLVTRSIPGVRYELGVVSYLITWVMIDSVRYPYYFMSLLGKPPYILTWLRYTSFIPLYPLGYLAELTTVYAAMLKVWETNQYSFTVAGTEINFYYLLLSYMAFSCFGFFQNYSYMFSQRKKALKKAKTN